MTVRPFGGGGPSDRSALCLRLERRAEDSTSAAGNFRAASRAALTAWISAGTRGAVAAVAVTIAFLASPAAAVTIAFLASPAAGYLTARRSSSTAACSPRNRVPFGIRLKQEWGPVSAMSVSGRRPSES
jgi:hypothetical protein